jgi:two-component SAPR family response regulator
MSSMILFKHYWREFKASKYDLLLLDIKMPRMNGFELYREIQKIDYKVKVCFITAFVTYYESLREIFDMRNIHCIIKKPIETSNLIERIMMRGSYVSCMLSE